jgi:hypothetical protein
VCKWICLPKKSLMRQQIIPMQLNGYGFDMHQTPPSGPSL